MIPFYKIYLFNDVHDKLYAFQHLYLDILNEHASLKQTRIGGKQMPYMT